MPQTFVNLNDVRVLLREFLRKDSKVGVFVENLVTKGQIVLTATTGTPPLVVSSTSLVSNLNADLLDGFHASDFVRTFDTVSGIVNEAIDDRVAALLQNTSAATWTYDDGAGTLSLSISHAGLNGLGGDDHTQYARVDGGRNFTENQTFNKDVVVSQKLTTTNIRIPGGTAGYVLVSDSSGNGSWVASSTSVHSALLGLSADDHTQYARADGTRPITGPQTFLSDLRVAGNLSTSTFRVSTGASAGLVLASDALGNATWTAIANAHGTLTGLSNDDHPQYLNINGRPGGQTANGGTGAGENLVLRSTGSVSKGKIYLGSSTYYDETTNGLTVAGTVQASGVTIPTGAIDGYILTTDSLGRATWKVNSGGGAAASGVTIGGTVTSGTANTILYEDASQNLASSSNLSYNGSTLGLTGNLTVTNGQISGSHASNGFLTSFTGAGASQATGLTMGHSNTSNSFHPTVTLYKSRTASTDVVSGDTLGKIVWQGLSNLSTRTAAQISATADGTPGATWTPGRLSFSTTNSTGTLVEALTITTSGWVGVNNANPGYPLDIFGTTRTTALIIPTAAVSGYILTSDASGNASWRASTADVAVAGSGIVISTIGTTQTINSRLVVGSPIDSGGTKRILYEDASSNLAAATNFTFDGTNVGIGTAASSPSSILDIHNTVGSQTILNRGSTVQAAWALTDAGGYSTIGTITNHPFYLVTGGGAGGVSALQVGGGGTDLNIYVDPASLVVTQSGIIRGNLSVAGTSSLTGQVTIGTPGVSGYVFTDIGSGKGAWLAAPSSDVSIAGSGIVISTVGSTQTISSFVSQGQSIYGALPAAVLWTDNTGHITTDSTLIYNTAVGELNVKKLSSIGVQDLTLGTDAAQIVRFNINGIQSATVDSSGISTSGLVLSTPGASGYVLTDIGAGRGAWLAPAASLAIGSAVLGGTSTSIPYITTSGTLEQTSNLTFDPTLAALGVPTVNAPTVTAVTQVFSNKFSGFSNQNVAVVGSGTGKILLKANDSQQVAVVDTSGISMSGLILSTISASGYVMTDVGGGVGAWLPSTASVAGSGVIVSTVGTTQTVNSSVTFPQASGLTSGVDTFLHFHSTDRARANHTGTQLAATISDLTSAIDTEFDTRLATKSTSNLSEGSNLYYLDERVDDRLAALLVGASGISTSYNDAANQLTINGVFDLPGSGITVASVNGTRTLNSTASVSGSSNSLAKFTATSVIGNSTITDDGTTISFLPGGTRKATVTSAGVSASGIVMLGSGNDIFSATTVIDPASTGEPRGFFMNGYYNGLGNGVLPSTFWATMNYNQVGAVTTDHGGAVFGRVIAPSGVQGFHFGVEGNAWSSAIPSTAACVGVIGHAIHKDDTTVPLGPTIGVNARAESTTANLLSTRAVGDIMAFRAETYGGTPGRKYALYDQNVGDQIVILGNIRRIPQAAQTITAAGTILDDGAGGIKQVTAASPVKTSLTATLTAPSSGGAAGTDGTDNTGSWQIVTNVGSSTITMANNPGIFYTDGGKDVTLASTDSVIVVSNGSAWVQAAPVRHTNGLITPNMASIGGYDISVTPPTSGLLVSGSVGIGTTTPLATSKVSIAQAGGAGIIGAMGLYSGTSVDYVFQSMGRTAAEFYMGTVATTNQFMTGAAAGDTFLANASNTNKIFIASGTSKVPELTVKLNAVGIGTTTPTRSLEVIGSGYMSSDVTTGGNVATAPVVGGTTGKWKLGKKLTSGALTLSTTAYLEVEIDGVRYQIATVTG